MIIEGAVLLLKDEKGDLLNDIDTDMIFHNRHLAITDVNEMGKHALGNLKGYEHLPSSKGKVQILIAGTTSARALRGSRLWIVSSHWE